MRKIFLFIIVGLFLINLSSAFEFDNVKDYDPITREVTITNAYGLGDVIGKARLNTPLNVKVGAGYQKVAEFDIWAYDDYNDALKQFTFEDMKNGRQKINRDYDMKYLTYEDIIVNDYETECYTDYSNSTNGTQICNSIVIGTHLENKEKWVKVTPANLKKNEVLTIGIFTEVLIGDYVDWIPTIYGVEVEEWATWTAELNVNLISYYTLNGTSGSVIDSTGTNPATNVGATRGVVGKINNSFSLDGSNDQVNIGTSIISVNEEWTINLWVKSGLSSQTSFPVSQSADSSGRQRAGIRQSGTIYQAVSSSSPTTQVFVSSTTTVSTSSYQMVTAVRDSSSVKIYVDGGSAEGSGGWSSPDFGANNDMFIGTRGAPSSSQFFNGEVDEVGIWNRALSEAEITQLYNGGSGITYTNQFGSGSPNITLNSPSSENFTTPQNLTINFTAWDDINLSSVKLYVNDILNQTNASGINNSVYLFDLDLSDGEYIIYGTATDNESQETNSSSIQININTIPFIEFLTPPTIEDGGSTTLNIVPIEINTTTTLFKNITYSLRNTNTTTFTQFYENETFNITFISIPQGAYNYDVEICTTTDKCNTTETRNLSIHTTPLGLVIHDPKPIIDYHLLGTNLTLNWTVSEPGENLTEHVTNCTYVYNEVLTILNNTICTQINQTSFLYVLGVNNLTFTVTDAFGLVNSTSVSWDIKLTELNQTYNNQTIEGNLETFLARVRLGQGYSIAGAVLINYNSSENIGQSFTDGADTVLRKADFLVPNVEVDTNVTFFWNVTLSDSTNLALSSNNQTITKLSIDNCSSFTTELLNLTVVDEEEQTILPNATIETAVNIYDQSRTALVLDFSDSYEGVNPLRICLNTNLTENTMLSMDTIVKYENEDHAIEYYNIVNLSLTNETVSQVITLYDLSLNDSTDFQLSFTGSDFLPVENALVSVERQYISENVFKTVELPKTDYNGQSVLHLVRNDVIYNIRIMKEGAVLGNFENLVAFCDDFTIGDCNIELNAFDSVEGVFDYNADLGIIFNAPEYNATLDLISFNFVTSDGTAKEVLLEVTRNDIFGNRSICNSSLISSGGTLSCNIDPNLDETTLNTNVYVNDIISVKTSVNLDSSNYGEGGSLVAFVLTFSLILFFVKSKEGILISLGLSLASTIGLGLQSGSMTGLGASGVWLLVIILLGIYKLNRNRQQ